MPRRRLKKYSAEQKAARAAADARVRAGGAALLADPAAVAVLATRVMSTRSAKLLSYSLRNAAMVIFQADQRGMDLTDVDTYEGWQARGRQVSRDQPGLRIVRPRRTDAGGESAEQDPAGGARRRPGFWMSSVFDISQTHPKDSAERPDPAELSVPVEPEPVHDPDEVLRTNLLEQFERLGYTITSPDHTHSDAAVVDDQARTVAAPADLPVPELAQALAALLTRRDTDRAIDTDRAAERDQAESSAGHLDTNDPSDPDSATDTGGAPVPAVREDPALDPHAPRPVRLALGEHYGAARGTVRTDWGSGRTYYTLTAPRARGSWTVSIADPADQDRLRTVNVDYGEHDGRYRPSEDHARLPQVNGITIIGGTHGLDLEDIDRVDTWRINCQRPTGRYSSCQAPERTAAQMAAIVRAILRHFAARSDLDELHRAAARVAAPARLREETEKITELDDEIYALVTRANDHRERARQFAGLALPGDHT